MYPAAHFPIIDDIDINNSLSSRVISLYLFFLQISFLFVDPQFQRQGIGAKLLHSAITSIKRSGVKRPIHLEGAKSAVKFFKKQRFISFGKAENGARRGIFSTLFNMQHNFS